MLVRGRTFLASAVAALALLATFLAVPAARAQDSDCFTAVARDATLTGRLVAADTEGPRVIHAEHGYSWQAMALHPETGNLWAWGAGSGAGLGELYVYDPAGTEISESTFPALRDAVVDQVLFLGDDGRRMIGRGHESRAAGTDFLFSLETENPVTTFRIRAVDAPAIALLAFDQRVIAILAYQREPGGPYDGPSPALVYDRRTRALTETAVRIPYLVGAHHDAAGRLWLLRNGSAGATLALVSNPEADPAAWEIVDRSADAPAGTMGGASSAASCDGVFALYSVRGVTTFRDGVKIASLAVDSTYTSAFPAIMVSEGGGAVLFGGPLRNGSGEGWLEARSADLARLYWREPLPGEPTWMAAAAGGR